jgi:hypothetical protein
MDSRDAGSSILYIVGQARTAGAGGHAPEKSMHFNRKADFSEFENKVWLDS